MTEKITNPLLQPLRAKQYETIERVLRNPGSLTIAALPTGFGKTRIVQIATYLLRKNHIIRETRPNSGWSEKDGDSGPTLIISPLVALMDDQREKWDVEFNERLEKAGLERIKTRFLTTGDLTRDPEKMEQLRNNEIDVLCCSPEDLMDPKRKRNHWLETFARMKVPFSMMVVDEAHIIGSWGASIRPQFQLLSLVKDRLLDRNSNLRVLLMSATISISEEKELIRLFSSGLNHKKIVNDSTTAIRIKEDGTRPDLYFDISYYGKIRGDEEHRNAMIQELSREMFEELNEINLNITSDWNKKTDGTKFREDGRPSPLLIYTPYPTDADGFLKRQAIEILTQGNRRLVKTYTGKTSPDSRQKRLSEFVNNEIRAMIATSAFGMGVDKPDAWIVSYFGMPYSLSDLYQGFGRAARHNDWKSFGHKKSGYCKGVLFGKSRPFSPRMQLPLTTERFWDMLSQYQSYVTENGYIVLDISANLAEKYWSTLGNDETVYIQSEAVADGQDEEGAEGQISDMVQQHVAKNSIFNPVSWERDYSEMKKIKELLSLRLWSIACLQREGKIELLGFHPAVLYSDHGVPVLLKDVLSNEGYDGVVAALNKQGIEEYKTPAEQNRLVVIKANTDFNTFEDFKSGISMGLGRLETRHKEGQEELDNFLKIAGNDSAEGCYRQLFAKTIGLVSERSCIEQITDNLSKPDNNRDVVMPCSKCRRNDFFAKRGLSPDNIMMSTGPIIQLIRDGAILDTSRRGRKKQRKYSLVVIYNNKILNCDTDDYDFISGTYEVDTELTEGSFEIITNEEKIGSVTIKSGSLVEIETKYPIEWEEFSHVLVREGEDKAYLDIKIR